MILPSVASFLLAIAAGFLLVHLLWPDGHGWAIAVKLFLGIGLGLGVTACLYFLRVLLFPGQGGYILIQIGFLALVLFAFFLRGRPPFHFSFQSRPVSAWQIFFGVAALLVFGFTVYSSILYSRINPHGDYDAQAIWNLRARSIYRLGDDWHQAFSPEINRNFHMDYPLLIPMNVVGGWNTLQGEVLRIPAVQGLLFLVGLAGLMYSILVFMRSSSQASIATIVLLATPLVLIYSTFQTADIPLAYFFLAALALFILAYQENLKGLFFLCGLMAGLAAWTKNEGQSFALIIAISGLIIAIRMGKWQNFLSLLGGMAFPLLTLLAFRTTIPATNDLLSEKSPVQLIQKFLEFPRYGLILSYLKTELANLGSWPINILLVLTAYGLVLGLEPTPRRRVEWWFILIVAAQFIVYLMIYLITPNELEWQLKYSLSRLLIHVFPMAVLLFFLYIRTPEHVYNSIPIVSNES